MKAYVSVTAETVYVRIGTPRSEVVMLCSTVEYAVRWCIHMGYIPVVQNEE